MFYLINTYRTTFKQKIQYRKDTHLTTLLNIQRNWYLCVMNMFLWKSSSEIFWTDFDFGPFQWFPISFSHFPTYSVPVSPFECSLVIQSIQVGQVTSIVPPATFVFGWTVIDITYINRRKPLVVVISHWISWKTKCFY